MGLGNFLKSLVSPEALGEEIIANQERQYRALAIQLPHAEPHELLMRVWLSRMMAAGHNIASEVVAQQSFIETHQFACIAPPKNARALGLWFVYKERPDLLERFPHFGREYEELMSPILAANENGSLMELYRRHNPITAAGAGS